MSFFTKDDKVRPLTPAQSQPYIDPQMQIFRAHGIDEPLHLSSFRVDGTANKISHLANYHSSDPERAYAQLVDMNDQQLNDFHASLHRQRMEGILEQEEYASTVEKVRTGVELSPEDRELFERLRPKVQAPAISPESGRLVTQPANPVVYREGPFGTHALTGFGPHIERQITFPRPEPYYGPTGKRLRTEDVQETIARDRRIKELQELGLSFEQASEEYYRERE